MSKTTRTIEVTIIIPEQLEATISPEQALLNMEIAANSTGFVRYHIKEVL